MVRQDDFLKSLLALTAWQHGREYGGYLPTCMIMGCIANRVRLGWGSWMEMIERVPAYSAIMNMPTGYPSIWDVNFVRILNEVEGIYGGSANDMSKGALYWADLRHIENPWFKEKILGNLEQHPRIADCNSLVLFR